VHLNQVNRYEGNDNNKYEYEYGYKEVERARVKGKSVAFHVAQSVEKHQKEKKKEKHQKKNHHDRFGQQQQQLQPCVSSAIDVDAGGSPSLAQCLDAHIIDAVQDADCIAQGSRASSTASQTRHDETKKRQQDKVSRDQLSQENYN